MRDIIRGIAPFQIVFYAFPVLTISILLIFCERRKQLRMGDEIKFEDVESLSFFARMQFFAMCDKMLPELPELTNDKVFKHIFSAQTHPDRYEFLLNRLFKVDKKIRSSAANEGIALGEESNISISDDSVYTTDGYLIDMEMQAKPETVLGPGDHIKTTMDGVGFRIIFMKKSPAEFNDGYDDQRYIHIIEDEVCDTGLRIPRLCQKVYVQLDKALEVFRSKTYEPDEDTELLLWLSMIADVNAPDIIEAVKGNEALMKIREDLKVFSSKKGVREMLVREMAAEMDYNFAIREAEKRGKEKILIEQVSDGVVSEEYAAQKLNVSVEEFRAMCK